MKLKGRLAANIDLGDAFFGGVVIYVSVFLLQSLFFLGTGVIATLSGLDENIYTSANGGYFVAAFFAVNLALFLVLVLFEENFFSKHEKRFIDLVGLGLVWGGVFLMLDMLFDLFTTFVSLAQNTGSFYVISLRNSLGDVFFFLIVVVVAAAPMGFHYLRDSHMKFMEKQ